jgi:hypothetical protein
MRPNRPMSAVERFFERLVERPSARLFGTRAQPVQLQRRIERAMEHGRRVVAGQSRVPDRFTVRLSQADLQTLDQASVLPVELASAALAWARRRGYAVSARPRVAIVADRGLRAGDIEVEARFSVAGDGPDLDALEDLGQTRIFAAPTLRSPRATLAIRDASGREWTIVADGAPLMIGRSEGNTVALADERVSRQHARLHARGGVLVLVDLESTNGTQVNGSRITEVAVGAGDVVEIGGATITIVAIDDDVRPDDTHFEASDPDSTEA